MRKNAKTGDYYSLLRGEGFLGFPLEKGRLDLKSTFKFKGALLVALNGEKAEGDW